jgi:hypothetical protein
MVTRVPYASDMPRRRLTVLDACGRRVELGNPRLRRLDRRQRSRLGEVRVELLEHTLGWVADGVSMALLCIGAVMVLRNGARIFYTGPLARGAAMDFLFILVGGSLIGLGWRYAVGRTGVNAERVKEKFLALNVCPCCIEPLDDRPIDNQRRATCAGCQAVWRLAVQCRHCGYDLAGLASADTRKCPECGHELE